MISSINRAVHGQLDVNRGELPSFDAHTNQQTPLFGMEVAIDPSLSPSLTILLKTPLSTVLTLHSPTRSINKISN